MSFLRENVINNTLNYIVLYKIIMRMITNIQDTKAYKLGIVDKNGKILRKRRTLKTKEEKDSLTRLDIFVFNLKRILGPLARSKLVNITAALFLLKEQDNLNNLEDFENRYTLLETGYSEFESSLDSKDLKIIEKMSETLEEDIGRKLSYRCLLISMFLMIYAIHYRFKIILVILGLCPFFNSQILQLTCKYTFDN